MSAPTDENLLREYVSGDKASFELLVRRHSPELYHFAARITGNSVSAEDIVQETLLQVHISARTFDPGRRFKPWLFTIAANKARDLLRRRDRKREVPFESTLPEDDQGSYRLGELLSAPTLDPVDELSVEERRTVVRQLVGEMPLRLREVLILSYYHRFAYREMADIMGVPVGTVKSRLHSAVLHFAERYRERLRERAE